MPRGDLIVLKFGGSVLKDRAAIAPVVHEVYRWHRQGLRVIAVVSAFEGVTDALIAEARQAAPSADREPDAGCLANLLFTGELTTASLLGLALRDVGVPARVLTPHQIGLRVQGDALDADPASVDADAIARALKDTPVLVVPGFLGIADDGSLRTLGRGGSDLSAIFLAATCGATACRLVKDVPGLFEADPHADPAARRYSAVTFDRALELDGGIIQHKAVRFARGHSLRFELAALQADETTLVGASETVFATAPAPRPPLRIAIAGAGTVGLGVYERLANLPDQARVVAVACRDAGKAQANGVPRDLITTLDGLELDDVDVLIEVIGGLEPAGSLVQSALDRGVHVVTANKALVAARHNAAFTTPPEARLLCSATVGGGTPCIEAVRALAPLGITRIEGVINATSNVILSDLANGTPFAQALSRARALGLAEADPTRDLTGLDAADKLAILAHLAFGETIDPSATPRDHLTPSTIPVPPPYRLRQVGTLKRANHGISASVRLTALPPDHPLNGVDGADNAIVVQTANGQSHLIRGSGAGRWPTTESVIADVLELWREHRPRHPRPISVVRTIYRGSDNTNRVTGAIEDLPHPDRQQLTHS